MPSGDSLHILAAIQLAVTTPMTVHPAIGLAFRPAIGLLFRAHPGDERQGDHPPSDNRTTKPNLSSISIGCGYIKPVCELETPSTRKSAGGWAVLIVIHLS